MPIRKKNRTSENVTSEKNNGLIRKPMYEAVKAAPEIIKKASGMSALSGFQPSTSSSISRTASVHGVLTVVNSKRNGKRLVLSASMMEHLNNPDTLQVLMSSDSVAFGESLPGCTMSYTIKKGGKKSIKGIMYAGMLVEEIAQHFNLDFSNRVSITFTDAELLNIEDTPIAIVNVPDGFRTNAENNITDDTDETDIEDEEDDENDTETDEDEKAEEDNTESDEYED